MYNWIYHEDNGNGFHSFPEYTLEQGWDNVVTETETDDRIIKEKTLMAQLITI